jgi:hypothetical protein
MQACRKPTPPLFAALWMLAGLFGLSAATAHEATDAATLDARRLAPLLRVTGKPGPPPPGVADLKFNELFKLPIGPRGLEPTDKLLGLDGKRVRIFGYMVNAEEPAPGPFILAPLAVSTAEKEDGPADDLPATVVFVHLAQGEREIIPHVSGLLKLTGVLSLGPKEEPDGRVSAVRLLADPALSKNLLRQRPKSH